MPPLLVVIRVGFQCGYKLISIDSTNQASKPNPVASDKGILSPSMFDDLTTRGVYTHIRK